MYWFQLWREFKLSIAEILAVFPEWKIIYFDREILLLDFNDEKILKKANNLWWTIKIFELIDFFPENNFKENILNYFKKQEIIWKYKYWINIFFINILFLSLCN